MKKYPFLLASIAAAVATLVWLSWQRQSELAGQARRLAAAQAEAAALRTEQARLESDLRAALDRQNITLVTAAASTPAPVTTNTTDPGQIIAELTRLRIRNGPTRVRDLQEVVFRLRTLAHTGDPAVPAIAAYLARFEDVEYPVAGEAEPEPETDDPADPADAANRPATTAAGKQPPDRRTQRRGRLQFDFLTPPSLRLGLADVLAEIATPAAEAALADALKSTGRGIEVACFSRKLQVLNPNHYRDEALNAARELLVKPVALSGKSPFDAQQKAYLYSVFDFYHDTSFTSLAPGMLVDPQGRLDRDALGYLSKSLNTEQILPWVYQAFTSGGLTNVADRSRLLQTALPAAGRDPYANAMIRDVLHNPAVSADVRGMVVRAMAEDADRRGGRRPDQEVDVAGIQARLQFLDQLRGEFTDPALTKSFDRAAKILNAQLEPPKKTGGPGAGRRFKPN